MRKVTLLLAIVAVAAVPSLASAKTTKHKMHHARAHHAKVTKVAKYEDPNINTWRLFGLVRDDKPAPKAKKK